MPVFHTILTISSFKTRFVFSYKPYLQTKMDDFNIENILDLEEQNTMEIVQNSNYGTDEISDMDFLNSFLSDLQDVEYVVDRNDQTSENNQLPIHAESPTTSSSTPYKTSLEDNKRPFETLTNPVNVTKSKTLCPICKDGDAGFHKHYGGKACVSCRAFFRRSVQNDTYREFACKHNGDNAIIGNCEINSKSWSSCRYCRFQKCLGSGLLISLVLTPSQRYVRQSRRITKDNKRSNQAIIHLKSYTPKINANALSTASFTDHEVTMISFRVNTFITDYLRKGLLNFFVKNSSCLDAFLRMFGQKNAEVGIDDIANKQNCHGKWWQGVFKQFLSETYEEHQALAPDVLETLYNYNMAVVYYINSAMQLVNGVITSPLKEIMESVYEKQKYLSQYLPHTTSYQDELNLAIDQNNQKDNYDNAITIIATRALKTKADIKPCYNGINYDQAFLKVNQMCIQTVTQTEKFVKWEKILRKNTHDVGKWPTFFNVEKTKNITKPKKSNQNLIPVNDSPVRNSSSDINIDYVLPHLLSIVALYSTDNCKNVQDPSTIQKLQSQYLTLLHKYLKFRYPADAYPRLARAMVVLSKAQESVEILQNYTSLLSAYTCTRTASN